MVRRKKGRDLVCYCIMILAVLIVLIPIGWMALTSLKPYRWLVYGEKPTFIFEPSIIHYQEIFEHPYLAGPRVVNSLIISTVGTILATVLGILGAYVFSRYKIRGAKNLAFFILSIRFLPPIAVAVPLFILFTSYGLIDTYPGLILAYGTFNLPFAMWLILGFINEIPKDIDESAMLDGYSRLQIIRHFILPLCAPGIAVTALFTFIFIWNEFLVSYYLTREGTATMIMFITSMRLFHGFEWEKLYAATIIHFIPVLVIALFLQKYIVRGLTFGAVK